MQLCVIARVYMKRVFSLVFRRSRKTTISKLGGPRNIYLSKNASAHNVHIRWRKKSQNRIRKIWLLLRSANKAELMRFTAAQKPKRGFSYIHSLIDNGISKGGERRGIYFIWFFYFSDSKVIGVSLLSAWGQQLLMFVVLGRKSQALIVSSYIHSPLEKKNQVVTSSHIFSDSLILY